MLLVILLRPVVMGYLKLRDFKRDFERQYRQASRNAGTYGNARDKRFADEGEYVDFEDVEGDSIYAETVNSTADEPFAPSEEQISDAEFEEIKE